VGEGKEEEGMHGRHMRSLISEFFSLCFWVDAEILNFPNEVKRSLV
jgi:hypothetical protein